jgi:hypothetical protein
VLTQPCRSRARSWCRRAGRPLRCASRWRARPPARAPGLLWQRSPNAPEREHNLTGRSNRAGADVQTGGYVIDCTRRSDSMPGSPPSALHSPRFS